MLVGYFQQNLLKMLESMHDFMTFSEEPRGKKAHFSLQRLTELSSVTVKSE